MDQVNSQQLVLRENVKKHEIADGLASNPRFILPAEYSNRKENRNKVKDEQWIRSNYAKYLAATLALDDYLGRLMQTLTNSQ